VSVRDRGILLALPILALLAAFWFLLLAPKREEASELESEVSALQAAVSDQEQIAAAAEEAREAFPRNYRRVVVLGKAVPADADTSSLLVQLTRLANESGVEFTSIELSDSAAAAAESSATEPSTPAPAQPSVQDVPSETPASAPAPPTEVAAASLPLGAVVGPAGLPVMPYELQFRGDFFAIAEFIARVNKMVELDRDGRPAAFGRLITIDGFALTTPDATEGPASSTTLEASFAVTTYVTPESEGATAGATPAGPAPPEAGTAVSESTETAPPAPPAASAGASVAGATP
jgi:Tfp pilus assembly protein PilO